MAQGFDVTIEPIWQLVRKIRNDVAQVLTEYPPEIRSAATITASELLENAIKYGEPVEHAPNIRVALTVEDRLIRIETVNGSTNLAGVAELQRVVREVSHLENAEALYVRRLEELLATPTESGKLGIYRIAFEGRFELSCTYEANVVKVTATRKLS